MPNASNTDRVRAAIGGVETTRERAVLAVQGPQARDRLATIWPDAAAIGRFRVGHAHWHGTDCTVAGTGYTGEAGVEIAVPAASAAELWEAVVAAGVQPAGPRRPRHPSTRSWPSAARPRTRPRHHPVASRSRVGRRLEQDRLPGPRRTRRRTGPRRRSSPCRSCGRRSPPATRRLPDPRRRRRSPAP